MMETISNHFINLQGIEGGIRVDLGYAGILGLILLGILWHRSKKMFSKKSS